MATPAGWYRDPWNAARWRYWDGVAWTANVSPPPVTTPTLPPPVSPPAPTSGLVRRVVPPGFRSLRGLATALLVLFIVLACAYGLLAAFVGARIALVGRILNQENVTIAEANDADDAVAGGVALIVLPAIAVLVVFVVWLWRAYSNVEALGVGPRRYGRGWVIGAWFVPIANLFIPKQIVNDCWRAADERAPGNPRWAKLPVAGVITAWWITFLVSTLGFRAAVASIGNESLESVRNSDWAAVAACLVAVASCVLGIISVRTVTARQHRRAGA
jgi:Domain of unknown function (DUF4328)/Protein of unknown function (DUF2510)